MIIASQKTFSISLVMLVLSVLQLSHAFQVMETTATRDFNFGPPMLIVLAVVQIVVSGFGIVSSLSKKPEK
jgi:hypothetical protein